MSADGGWVPPDDEAALPGLAVLRHDALIEAVVEAWARDDRARRAALLLQRVDRSWERTSGHQWRRGYTGTVDLFSPYLSQMMAAQDRGLL